MDSLEPRVKILSPSILAYDNCNIVDGVDLIARTSAEWIHVDVMDGTFVPSITFGQAVVNGIKQRVNKKLDVHLMTQFPKNLIESFAVAGADFITFHHESSSDTQETIDLIKSCKKLVGLAIKPETNVDEIGQFFSELDLILIMSVEPGKCGQKFIPTTYDKLTFLRRIKKASNYKFLLSVDGGINSANLDHVYANGADVCVVGSAFFSENEFFRKRFPGN